MPTKPATQPDLATQRTARLLERIRTAIPATGIKGESLDWHLAHWLSAQGFTQREYRAAKIALVQSGAITYSRAVYSRGDMF